MIAQTMLCGFAKEVRHTMIMLCCTGRIPEITIGETFRYSNAEASMLVSAISNLMKHFIENYVTSLSL